MVSTLSNIQWADGKFGSASYRAYKANWTSHPTTVPDVTIQDGRLYMSWNGATELKHWEVFIGNTPRLLNGIVRFPKTTFESSIGIIDLQSRYFRVDALDDEGRVLSSSKVIQMPATYEGCNYLAPLLLAAFLVLVFAFRRSRRKDNRTVLPSSLNIKKKGTGSRSVKFIPPTQYLS